MAVAEGARLAVDPQRAGAHERPRVPLAERLQRRELRQQAGRDLARLQVQLVLDPPRQQLRRPAAPAASHSPPQLLQPVGSRRQPDRLRVAAEALHPLFPGGEEAVQLEARHAAPGAGRQLALDRQQHHRAMEILGHPAGGDPTTPLCQLRAPGRPGSAAAASAPPRTAAVASSTTRVSAVCRSRFQPSSSAASSAARPASRLISSSSARSGLVQPPRRVDPRADAEADVRGGERRLHPGLQDERLEPLRPRLGRAP